MDLATDQIIHTTLAERFAKATVLTIAHRLDTLLPDSDIIVVMQGGSAVEIG